MSYSIEFADSFSWKSLKCIPREDALLIQEMIQKKLAVQPELFGKPLRFAYKGCWRLRIGHYRIIYRLKGKTVIILSVGNRAKVY